MAQTITLNFKIIGQSLERLDDNRIVEKAKNYVNTQFEFNDVWDNTTKAIIIEGSGLRYKVYLNENNECLIPNRAVRYDGFSLTVVGEDTDKNITITTNELYIGVGKSNATEDIPTYVEEIESETLDVTRHGEKYNIEIPSEYVTDTKLSQELENYVDNESLEETLEDYAKETDLSVYATKQELNEKSKVVANPTLSGDEPDLEGAEIDGVKYKVGGGDVKLYNHNVNIRGYNGSAFWTFCAINVTRKDNTPITINDLIDKGVSPSYTKMSVGANNSNSSIGFLDCYRNNDIITIRVTLPGGTPTALTNTSIIDTITEI